jgi:DNA-binding HxlR family transcriptional regulator
VRSYDQYCGLARALDVVGERWSLLVVRELLEGPRRFNELLDGLPGVASNLLSERLRSLESTGVIVHRDDNRYALTDWGMGLHEAIYALGRWAGPLMTSRGKAEFRPQWLRHMVIARFEGVDPERKELEVEVRFAGGEPMTLLSARGRVHLIPGQAQHPDVVLSGPADGVAGLLGGRLSKADAVRKGVRIQGDARLLAHLRPRTGFPVREAPRATSRAS